jgi:hypothetical protein
MPYQNPFALPKAMKPELQRALEYWRSLKRGENNIPFADDVSLAALRNTQVLLLKVFAAPQRFRFEFLGDGVGAVSKTYAGKFLDEITPQGPISYLQAQCCATVESREPTFCHLMASGPDRGFTRLLLPTWGDGHIETLLGAIADE